MQQLLLLGDEAIAQGAVDAGISGVYAYPGTPSTEITEYIPTLYGLPSPERITESVSDNFTSMRNGKDPLKSNP